MILPDHSTERLIKEKYSTVNSISQLAVVTNLSKTTCFRYFKSLGLQPYKNVGGAKKRLSTRKEKFVVSQITSGNSKSLKDVQKSLQEQFNIGVSTETLRTTLKKHQINAYKPIQKP